MLFDRNNHKAAHHGASFLGGGIPIYLPADRNAHGLIGPIDSGALDEAAIRELIRTHPLVQDPEAWRRERPFRAAMLFDEAWAGFMKFHPLYHGRFAMGLSDLDEDAPGIFATQSTHKQRAGLSQASQIHVRDSHLRGQRRRRTGGCMRCS